MRTPRSSPILLASLAALACLSTVAADALAFGGTAPDFDRQGNFVVRNTAGFAGQLATGFAFSQQVNSPSMTIFELRPAIDYFIIPNLTIGGAVDFHVVNFPSGNNNRETDTSFGIAPDVGYDFSLSDTFSFWPQGSLNFFFRSNGNPLVTLALLAPFLVHPAEHFFFGLGPGLQQDLTSNANTFLTGEFVLGGYFDH